MELSLSLSSGHEWRVISRPPKDTPFEVSHRGEGRMLP